MSVKEGSCPNTQDGRKQGELVQALTCWDFMPFSVRDDALSSKANLKQAAVKKVRQNTCLT